MKQIAIALTCGVFIVSAIADEPMGREYQTKLQAVIQQHHPDAKVEREDDRLVYRHHTQTFQIHTIHKTGHISEKPHDEEGPNVDGILVKVSLHEGEYRGQAVIPQTLHRPYWKTFINAYPVSGGQYLWVSISYGSKTDQKLINDIKTCFGPALPPRTETKNRPIQPKEGATLKDQMPHGERRVTIRQ